MSTETPVDDGERLPNAVMRSSLVQDDAPQIGRMHLNSAFKHMLMALPLPALSGFLGFWNLMTFFMQPGDRPRLCSLTPLYCDAFLSLPVFVVPAATIFTFASLFYLDRLLSVSPIFDPFKAFVEPLLRPQTGEGRADQTPDVGAQAPSDPGQAVRRTLSIIKFSIISSYILATLSALASSVAVTNASLVAKYDSPWGDYPGPPENRYKYQTRVGVGFGEAIVELLLTYYLCVAATALSGVKQTLVPMVPEELEGREPLGSHLSRVWKCVVARHWCRRSALDKAVLCLLVAFVLSFVSFTFDINYYPFRHLRHADDQWYIVSCLLTATLTWPALLVVHSFRSSGSYPGRVPRLATFAALFLLATVWGLVSFMYTVLSVSALFCDGATPLPPTSACLYVRSSGVWTGFVAALLGYVQAWCLGVAAVAVKGTESGVLRIGEGRGV